MTGNEHRLHHASVEEEYGRDEPVDYGICKHCEQMIGQLPGGAWRSTTTNVKVDRVACIVSEDRRHRPLEATQP